MPKLHTESYQEYRDRVLDSKSKSFCGAKWWNSTVWLGSGTTASCHHPPAHKIPLEEIKESYKALHNTQYKKSVRKQMLEGERPSECDYCWKVEDLGPHMVSDRVFKSVIYDDLVIAKAFNESKDTEDVDPKTLEIAFDATCNFACSYCNSSFSTQWMSDIKTNGPYTNLVSDGAGAFQQDGSWAQPYGLKNTNNPYVAAFMEWWENDLQYSLEELRITGGEATMSRDFWALMDWWKVHPECNVKLAVNSNLGVKTSLIDRLCETSHSFKSFDLYTSNESFGAHAEYIRDGLVWDEWLSNLNRVIENGKINSTHVMMTINALCLYSLTDLLDELLGIKKKHGRHHALLSFNILRFPSFQAAVTLPLEKRLERADHLENWLNENWNHRESTYDGRGELQQFEHDGMKRLISYLREVDEGHSHTSSLASRQRDFRSFFDQYDKRRGKNFVETFPVLGDWYLSLPITRIIPISISSETPEEAIIEGWVLDPSNVNPGSVDYVPPNIDTHK